MLQQVKRAEGDQIEGCESCAFAYFFREIHSMITGHVNTQVVYARLSALADWVERAITKSEHSNRVTVFWLEVWLALFEKFLQRVISIHDNAITDDLFNRPIHCEHPFHTETSYKHFYVKDVPKELEQARAKTLTGILKPQSFGIWQHLNERYRTAIAWRCSILGCKYHEMENAFENVPAFCQHMREQHGVTDRMEDMEVPQRVWFGSVGPCGLETATEFDDECMETENNFEAVQDECEVV